MMKKRGIGLTEILIVIGIGTVTLSILLPAISMTESRSKTRTCLSNLKQIGMAAQQYARDWDGMLPYAEGSSLPKTYPTQEYQEGSIATSLREKLAPYIKNSLVFKCPNDTGIPSLDITGSAYKILGSSYLWNDGLQRDASGIAKLSVNGSSLSSIQNPSQTPLSWDYSPLWHPELMREGVRIQMTGRVNVVYVDGHVRELQPAISMNNSAPFSDTSDDSEDTPIR